MSDSDSDIPLQQRITSNRPKNSRLESEDSDSDQPLASRLSSASRKPKKAIPMADDDDSEDDIPLAARKLPMSNGTSKSNGTKVKRRVSDSDSDSEVPLAKKLKPVLNGSANGTNGLKAVKKEKIKREPINDFKKRKRDSDSDTEKNATKKIVKREKSHATDVAASGSKKTKKKKQEEEEEEEEDYKWWLSQDNDGSVKWNSLEHNGVLFPPDYKPHGVKMKYDGKEVTLEPEAEEVASFFAALIGTDHGNNPTFQKNFFKDFLAILKKSKKPSPIKEFKKCDFTPIFEYLEKEKEKKKSMSKEEKAKIKAEKLAIDEKYGWCVLDGRKEKVGNFRIEPPGLFRGRGEHPKTGCLKQRVQPEQVTINIGKNASVPKPPSGHQWAKIIHDNTVTWLATWKENVNDSIKYVFLAAGSSLKGQSDLKKFEKARELKKSVATIRRDYTAQLRDKLMATRQRATAMYLIDRFALRAGNEKGEDEADTVGCCSLRYEHVTLEPPNKVIFDFLGKDSIRYYNEVEVDEQVFKNLKIFKKEPKTSGDLLFDRLTTAGLNKHLNMLMKGLTAKVFRTYNASHTFQEELKNTPVNGTVSEKILAYNRANREVAILCNHQRTVSKGHAGQMLRIKDKLLALRYQRQKLKQTILTMEPKLKKKRPDLAEPEEDLEDDWIREYEKQLMEKEREKARKKWEKENEERKEEGKHLLSEKELKETLRDIDDREKELARERKTGKVEPKKGATVDKLEGQIEKVTERIQNTLTAMIDKDENKTTALGTSKINYIDPRITISWCKKYDVPVEKMFNRSLQEKFKWAMDVDAKWVF